MLNDTRVLPARRFSDDGAIEFLFLEQIEPQRWRCLVKPGRKMRLGATTVLDGTLVRVEEICADGERLVRLDRAIDPYRAGQIPLPPYLERESDAEDEIAVSNGFRECAGSGGRADRGVAFHAGNSGEAAAHICDVACGHGDISAGAKRDDRGAPDARGAFYDHARSGAAINAAERVLAVGTTSVRVLESAARRDGKLFAQESATDIFIHPPYKFRAVDRLLTNFHLPRSTLLMLVAAFAGREFVFQAYREAVRQRYRFYSYGDCMLIL